MKWFLAIGVIAWIGWWFWGRTLEPARVVHAQLEAIGKHDYQAAYDLLSDKAKHRLTPEQFVELIRRNKIVENNYASEFFDRHMEKDIATFSGTVRALGREKTPATFTVVKQGDHWVIDEFHF